MIDKFLIAQRIDFIRGLLKQLMFLSGLTYEEFTKNDLNVAAAESYIRRCLEAIFDIGRHILAKTGCVELAGEYKSIARGLSGKNFISSDMGLKLVQMAGYRNRMVHFYSMVTDQELYEILQNNLKDIENFLVEIKQTVLLTKDTQGE